LRRSRFTLHFISEKKGKEKREERRENVKRRIIRFKSAIICEISEKKGKEKREELRAEIRNSNITG